MDRLACVDLPAFPLQLLLRRHPDWAELPAVVVDEDRPQGVILWANERARQASILPGHRYAHGLAMARTLRADIISPDDIAAAVDELTEQLRRFSPDIEPYADEPGVFWLNGAGLGQLYPSVNAWTSAIAGELTALGFEAAVCAGFTRFATYAVARANAAGGSHVFRDRASEARAAGKVALDRLVIDPDLRDVLAKLGVRRVDQFLALPAGGILRRFGKEAHRLHRLAAGGGWDPPRYRAPVEPAERRVALDDPESNLDSLVFAIKRALDPLLDRLAERKLALAALDVELLLHRAEPVKHEIRPAEPTLDARRLLRLLHLRLEASPPPAEVDEIALTAATVPAGAEQLALFSHKPKRDLRAADEALAVLRAELGNDAVVVASLRDAHLPEAQFRWEPLARAVKPHPRDGAPVLIRRIYVKPVMLPPQNQHVRDDGWILRGLEHGSVTRLAGPYIVSGGWWASEVHREYHYAETRRGECLWVYYDRHRRRWFLHGLVS